MLAKGAYVEIVKGSHCGRTGVVRQSCVDYFDSQSFNLVAVTIDQRTYWFTSNQLTTATSLIDPFDVIAYDLDDVRAASERYIGQWTGGEGLPVPVPKHLADLEGLKSAPEPSLLDRLAGLTFLEIFHKIFHPFRG